MTPLQRISEHLYCYTDTCNVYVLLYGRDALLIDFGSGDILDVLPELGVEWVRGVLMTHYHRDQGQGLKRAAEAGIPIYVPHSERDLFARVEEHWAGRALLCDYDVRQDRFSLLESVPVAWGLEDYTTFLFGDYALLVVPTPGHTLGSISLLAEIDGLRVAFTGDLIAAPGRLWSLAATQWTYNGGEGLPATVCSLLDLKRRDPDQFLPSHGEAIDQPDDAIYQLVECLRELMTLRRQNPRLMTLLETPYVQVTPHILWNQVSMAYGYVLLSESGKALLIDFGYDMMTGMSGGTDRSSRRPWLYTLDTLKRQFGVQQIDVVLPTHYHDDHVAGINLLRDVEGTAVWAADNYADLLEQPTRYDLPCLWYEPIPVDRRLPLESAVQWEEYTLTLYPLPGHTRYAVAIAFEVDGKRVLATGDQYQNQDEANYVYRNRYAVGDFVASAELYRRLNPDLILTGHWEPLWTPPGYLDMLTARSEAVDRLHRELLPPEVVNFDTQGLGARMQPYQTAVKVGACVEYEVEVTNPFAEPCEAKVTLCAPSGWIVEPPTQRIRLQAHETGKVVFGVWVGSVPVRRARIATDISVGGRRFGQLAEALVTIEG